MLCPQLVLTDTFERWEGTAKTDLYSYHIILNMLGLLCFWKSRHVLKKNTTSEEVKVLKFYSKAKASSFRQVVSYTEE